MSRKYNILIVNETSGPGGAETVVYETAANSDASRFNVRVVLLRPGWFLGHLQEHSIQTDIIESHRSFDISFIRRLAQFCRDNKIDLIHSHLSGTNLYCSVVGKITGIPVVTTAHNELFMPGSSERFSYLKNLIIRKLASANVLVADFMRENYVTLGKYPPSSLTTIHNGIRFAETPEPATLDELRREIGLTPDDIVIGNVANLRTPKGHQHLIDAARIVCQEMPQAKFLLIGEEGDGTIKRMIERKLDEYQLNSQVKLLGFRTDIPNLLHLLDIFVLASISEGLPLSVVEGMAAGKPVVVTAVGGLSEVVTEAVEGFLVPPADPVRLAERLLTLAKDAGLRKSMGDAGYKKARDEFSLESMMQKYQDLYISLIE